MVFPALFFHPFPFPLHFAFFPFPLVVPYLFIFLYSLSTPFATPLPPHFLSWWMGRVTGSMACCRFLQRLGVAEVRFLAGIMFGGRVTVGAGLPGDSNGGGRIVFGPLRLLIALSIIVRVEARRTRRACAVASGRTIHGGVTDCVWIITGRTGIRRVSLRFTDYHHILFSC